MRAAKRSFGATVVMAAVLAGGASACAEPDANTGPGKPSASSGAEVKPTEISKLRNSVECAGSVLCLFQNNDIEGPSLIFKNIFVPPGGVKFPLRGRAFDNGEDADNAVTAIGNATESCVSFFNDPDSLTPAFTMSPLTFLNADSISPGLGVGFLNDEISAVRIASC